jgi:hypothetical protein
MESATPIITFLVMAAVFIGILICRELVCWYFKLNQLSTKMDLVNKNLVAIRDELASQKQNP